MHRSQRAKAQPAYGTPCPKCGQVMYEGQPLDWGHIVAIALGGTDDINNKQWEHARCNRSSGATLGNQLRGNRASRDW